jgi:hypothetical protein
MKLVRESISFERGLNPKDALGIGPIVYDKQIVEKIKKLIEENVGGLYYEDLKYNSKLRIISITKLTWTWLGLKGIYEILDSLEKGSLKGKIVVKHTKNRFIVKIL